MLQNINFEYRYSSGRQNTPSSFFETALSNSNKLDIGLGYFSSACFNVLSIGFAHFIANGGYMRLYINQHINNDDIGILTNSQVVVFEKEIINSFQKLKNTFSKRDKLFFKCISYLISIKRIDIKIVIPRSGGLAHEKFGLFTDENNDKVSFTGSLNLTAGAFTRNIETIECTCSWKGSDNMSRVDATEKDFLDIWNGLNSDVLVYESEMFNSEIKNNFPTNDLDEIIIMEKEIISLIEQGAFQTNSTPYFPKKFDDGPRPYQIEAYEAWIKNNKNGIFAMATGTGKTITSLNCILEEYKKNKLYQALILVPTIDLVDQWHDELDLFNFQNIIEVHSENAQWRNELVKLKNKLRRGYTENFIIVSTYQSFSNVDFQHILSQLPESMILIADEAHNIGSPNIREIFRTLKIKYRIALSATPKRIYDEEGTIEIESFFNDSYPYIYNFPMSKAIREGYLMKYYYYPRIVYLNDEEMIKYVDLTQQLMNIFDQKQGVFKDTLQASKLLMLRKQIVHKAENKNILLENILKEISYEYLKYCFIYVPEGYTENENENILNKMLLTVKKTFPDITCNTYTGKNTKKERYAILDGFEKGKINVLLAMKCLDEGIDIPRAEYGIFASSTGNPRQFIQRRGRLLRKHDDKKYAYIYDMIVVPNYKSTNYSRNFFNMERSIVKGELTRIAYFADLAINTHSIIEELNDILYYYNLDIAELILNIDQ